jgi:thymidylate synthase ThyX
MKWSEAAYNEFLEDGLKPDQARGVLPLDLACDIIMSGTCEMWSHIIDERVQKAAHEQAQEVGWGMYHIVSEVINEWTY